MNIEWSKVNFIAAIVGARVSMGLFSNITSPTLPTLAQNCNVSIATVSWIFTVRSVASFIGAAGVHSGKLRYEFRKFHQRTIFGSKKAFKIINPTLILSLSLALAAVCLSCIPLGRFSYWVHFDKLMLWKPIWVTDFWLLCLLILIPGVAQGIVTGGLQSVILSLWGADKSRTLMQAYG